MHTGSAHSATNMYVPQICAYAYACTCVFTHTHAHTHTHGEKEEKKCEKPIWIFVDKGHEEWYVFKVSWYL